MADGDDKRQKFITFGGRADAMGPLGTTHPEIGQPFETGALTIIATPI